MNRIDLSIIVPCYNEAGGITTLRDMLLPVLAPLAERSSIELVLVDDGSNDGTGTALEDTFGVAGLPVAVQFVRHEKNRGLGAALRSGFAASHGEILVTTDSDGTYRFSEIPALIDCLQPGIDIVTASPYHPDGGVENVPFYRLILSRGSSYAYRLLVDPSIHTYTSLFRAYRRRVVEAIPFRSDGFLAGTELLVRVILADYRVAEYPAVLHSRVIGTSKAKIIRTIRAHLGLQMAVLLYRLRLHTGLSRQTSEGGSTWVR